MSHRISITLPSRTMERYTKIPEGSRSAVVRNLLESYFRAYDAAPKIFDSVLRGKIKLEAQNDPR